VNESYYCFPSSGSCSIVGEAGRRRMQGGCVKSAATAKHCGACGKASRQRSYVGERPLWRHGVLDRAPMWACGCAGECEPYELPANCRACGTRLSLAPAHGAPVVQSGSACKLACQTPIRLCNGRACSSRTTRRTAAAASRMRGGRRSGAAVCQNGSCGLVCTPGYNRVRRQNVRPRYEPRSLLQCRTICATRSVCQGHLRPAPTVATKPFAAAPCVDPAVRTVDFAHGAEKSHRAPAKRGNRLQWRRFARFQQSNDRFTFGSHSLWGDGFSVHPKRVFSNFGHF